MSLNFIIFIVTVTINGGLLALVVLKKFKSLKNPMYLSFIFSILCLLLWTLFNYLADTTCNHSYVLLYTRATIPAAFLMFWGVFVFSSFFPRRTVDQTKTFLFYSVIILVLSILSMTDLVIKDVTVNKFVGVVGVDNTSIFGIVMVLYILIFGHSICNFYRKFISFYGKQKEQVRCTLIGWTLFLVGAVVVSGVIPLITDDASFSKLGPLCSIFMVGFATYAILKHQFLDIRIVIQRGLIYTSLVGIVTGVYIISLQFIGYLVHVTTDITAVISAGVTTVLGVFFIKPLGDYFRRVTDPIFFKDRYDYPQALHQLSRVLNTNVTQSDIVDNSSQIIQSIFKAEWVKFHLLNKDPFLGTLDNKSISVDIVFQKDIIGILELGPKKSGDDYTYYDRQLLDTFAYQAAVALEKARLYEKVQDYSIHLEQLVDKRTLEIKKLQENQKQAMIDISHNLQTPLAVISGDIELMMDSNLNREKIQNVKSSLGRISQFINQLLHLSRLDQYAFDLDLTPLDLSIIIKEQIDYFEVMAEDRGVGIISSITEPVLILGNKKLIGELLTNLFTNSIKYRKQDLVKSIVSISLTKDFQNAFLIVEDNGLGISDKDLPQIFTRFYRGSNQSSADGTGLGLAICKKIIERHGGNISVESILGEKTIFTATFPLYNEK